LAAFVWGALILDSFVSGSAVSLPARGLGFHSMLSVPAMAMFAPTLVVLQTTTISIQNPVVMFGKLEITFGKNSVAGGRRIPGKAEIFFENLLRGTPDFYLRTVAFKG